MHSLFRRLLSVLFGVFSAVFFADLAMPAQAQERGAAAEEEELPESGTLSTSRTQGYVGSEAVDEPWGGVDASGETKSPISGSVSKISAREWKMFVKSNSEFKVYASVQVVQYALNGAKVKTDNFSYTLKPGESVERQVYATPQTASADLKLVSYKIYKEKVSQ